jgi:hypothetical protein
MPQTLGKPFKEYTIDDEGALVMGKDYEGGLITALFFLNQLNFFCLSSVSHSYVLTGWVGGRHQVRQDTQLGPGGQSLPRVGLPRHRDGGRHSAEGLLNPRHRFGACLRPGVSERGGRLPRSRRWGVVIPVLG